MNLSLRIINLFSLLKAFNYGLINNKTSVESKIVNIDPENTYESFKENVGKSKNKNNMKSLNLIDLSEKGIENEENEGMINYTPKELTSINKTLNSTSKTSATPKSVSLSATISNLTQNKSTLAFKSKPNSSGLLSKYSRLTKSKLPKKSNLMDKSNKSIVSRLVEKRSRLLKEKMVKSKKI